MNFRLIVNVEEGTKTLIGPKVPNINDCITLEDIYKKVTLNIYEQREVEIYGRIDAKSKWILIEECFDDDLEVITSLKFTEVKFKISPQLPVQQQVLQINPLNTMMQAAQQLQLPQLRRPENNHLDMLYNEIILLFQKKNAGWKGGSHNDIGKIFIERLTQTLWYIDPHLHKFKKRGCNLPLLFKELQTYSQNQHYNQFFNTSKHKKVEVTQEKLTSLVNSLDLCLVQPWTSKDQWVEVIPAILEFSQMIHKYIEYLKQVNAAMEKVHSSTTLVRDGINNINIQTTDWCEEEISSTYSELESLLQEKQCYEFVDLESYLPTSVVDRYHFIKNIQLGVSICLYRYYCDNYLGTKNFIWKIPNNWNDRSETKNAQVLMTIREFIPRYFSREMRKNMLKKVFFFFFLV